MQRSNNSARYPLNTADNVPSRKNKTEGHVAPEYRLAEFLGPILLLLFPLFRRQAEVPGVASPVFPHMRGTTPPGHNIGRSWGIARLISMSPYLDC